VAVVVAVLLVATEPQLQAVALAAVAMVAKVHQQQLLVVQVQPTQAVVEAVQVQYQEMVLLI
jgi:hypothetical protein